MAPALTQVETKQFVLYNQTSFLWCPAKGAPAPVIVWKKNRIVVQNSTSVRYSLGTVKSNNDTYSCEVMINGKLSRKEELVLSIESELQTYTGMSDLYVQECVKVTQTNFVLRSPEVSPIFRIRLGFVSNDYDTSLKCLLFHKSALYAKRTTLRELSWHKTHETELLRQFHNAHHPELFDVVFILGCRLNDNALCWF